MMTVQCADTPMAQNVGPVEAIEWVLTLKEIRQSLTTTGSCVLAVPELADDSHFHSPSINSAVAKKVCC